MPTCDRCGARATSSWVCPTGEHVLTWCDHCDREVRVRLVHEGWTRHRLPVVTRA